MPGRGSGGLPGRSSRDRRCRSMRRRLATLTSGPSGDQAMVPRPMCGTESVPMFVRSLMGLAEARRPAAAIGSVIGDVESESEPVGTTSVVSTSAAEVARIVVGRARG